MADACKMESVKNWNNVDILEEKSVFDLFAWLDYFETFIVKNFIEDEPIVYAPKEHEANQTENEELYCWTTRATEKY